MNKKVLEYFKKIDPKIYKYLLKLKREELSSIKPSEYFYRLSREIAYQQLHGKAASTIWGRFEDLFPNKKLTPEKVLSLKIEEMRACGLSNAKAQYIKNIAQAFINDKRYKRMDHLSDEEVIELLTKIKGVGRWTAEMFLMFSLGREDVFSFGDLGLILGLKKVYGMRKNPSKKRAESITKKWKPYRTYGSFALWEAKDNGE